MQHLFLDFFYPCISRSGGLPRHRYRDTMKPVTGRTKTDLEQALNALRQQGLRVTRARREILKVVIDDHGPFTIDEIHRRLASTRCDLVTVYRCLAALETAGLVRQCNFGDGIQRFEFAGGVHAHHHHHIVCTRCRSVETLDACVADELEEMVRQRGYTEVTHAMEFFGLCPSCRGQSA